VRLIDDLLDVSRITQGKVELKRSRVTLSEVVGAAVETSRPLIERGNHDLRITLEDPDIAFDADATRLAQVVSNLLNNASKFTPPGGSIEIRATREGDHGSIEVRDNGVGIPAEQQEDVFQMFSQVNRALSRSHGGLGIGLALARSLIELHGGTIKVESAGVNRGSTFTVRLPLAPEQSQSKRGAAAGGTVGHERRRILIVDDNHDAVDMLAAMLELSDYETKSANDGATAVAAAKEWSPDVIILDIGLPDMSGYEVARRLRDDAAFAETELIAVSGWGSHDDKRKAMAAGFNLHFTKPVDADALCNALARPPRPHLDPHSDSTH
jgi:CheY-like chemotaxis protein/two-component sensor histidine kinase